MLELADHVALVTGGGRGIGRSTAFMLAQCGAAVGILARSPGDVRAVAADIQQAGGRALPIVADIADYAAVSEAVGMLAAEFGPVDILINNAAIMPLGAVATSDPVEWTQGIGINLLGPYYCIRAMLPEMLKRKWGRIINVSSVLTTIPGSTNRSAYVTSKAALDRLTLAVAAEIAGTGVTINGVYPGMTDTAMQAQLRDAPSELVGAENQALYRDRYRRGELYDPQEPARLIAALVLGDRHGTIVNIDEPDGRELLNTIDG